MSIILNETGETMNNMYIQSCHCEMSSVFIAGFGFCFTGATPIDSFSCDPERYLGSLDDVEHVILHRKSYLHLQRSNTGVNTLLLCSIEEEMLSELKVSDK